MLELLLYLFTIVNLALYSYILFATGKRFNYSKAHRSFFILMFLVFGWILIRALENTFKAHWSILIDLDFAIAALISGALVVFALHYPRENKKLTIFKELLIYLPIIILAILTFLDFYYKIFSYRVIEYYYNHYYIYIFVLILYFILIGGLTFIRKLIKSSGIEKTQLKYITISYLISILILLFDSFYTVVEGPRSEDMDFIFFNFSILFVLIIGYVMIRYRFLDAKVIIKKGLVYGISLIIALAIYTYLVLAFKQTIEESWNINTTWTAAILIILVAVGFPPLKTLVEKVVNKLFKGRKSIDLAVAEVREKISHESDFENLVGIIKKEIKDYLQIENIQLFVLDRTSNDLIGKNGDTGKSISQKSNLIKYFNKYDEVLITEEIPHLMNERQGKFEREILQQAEKEMKKSNFNLVMPVKSDKEIIALVGFSGSARSFTVQDVDYLNKLREQITFAIANALLYQNAMKRIQGEI